MLFPYNALFCMQIEISPQYRCLANEQTIYEQLLSQLVLTKMLSLKRGEFCFNIRCLDKVSLVVVLQQQL